MAAAHPSSDPFFATTARQDARYGSVPRGTTITIAADHDRAERRQHGERRESDGGPPEGIPERRQQARRASDVPKPPCPWCGASTSVIYRSGRYGLSTEGYRRRHRCTECGGDWPTKELLDEAQFDRELAVRGLERVGGVIRPKVENNHGHR